MNFFINFTNMKLLLKINLLFLLAGFFQKGESVLCGKLAEQGQFKYMVAIKILPYYICGGAIIHANYILTAGHCVYDVTEDKITVVAGTVNIADDTGIIRSIKKIHIHPDFDSSMTKVQNRPCILRPIQWFIGPKVTKTMMKHDIALLELETQLELEGDIAIVNLPTSNELPLCTPCDSAGWGMTSNEGYGTDKLIALTLAINEFDPMGRASFVNTQPKFRVIDSELRSCPHKGDSGGPLVCNGIIYGVLAHGPMTPYYPTTCTSVFYYMDFIRETIGL